MDQHQPPQREIHRRGWRTDAQSFCSASHPLSQPRGTWLDDVFPGWCVELCCKEENELWMGYLVFYAGNGDETPPYILSRELWGDTSTTGWPLKCDEMVLGWEFFFSSVKLNSTHYWICMEFARVFATGWIEAIVLVYRMSRIYNRSSLSPHPDIVSLYGMANLNDHFVGRARTTTTGKV